ncbi:DUF572-domain-containing protein, partial [Glonium stellatum]
MQGFNMGRYYPPSSTSPPTFNKTHPLGSRASKLPLGILKVRFELPFAVWCTHCEPEALIGQGVRFNAEKRRVGRYHSTAVWGFRVQHGACGGWIEVRTDPGRAEYVVVSGGRRRDYGPEAPPGGEEEGGVGLLTAEERERRRLDAFAALEGTVRERAVERRTRERVEELLGERERAWADPYAANRRLREGFRVRRKGAEAEEARKEGMKERFGLGFDIVDEVEGDRVRAGLVEFGSVGVGDLEVERAARKPLFVLEHEVGRTEGKGKTSGEKKTRAQTEAERRKEALQQEIRGNTRAAMDPFL